MIILLFACYKRRSKNAENLATFSTVSDEQQLPPTSYNNFHGTDLEKSELNRDNIVLSEIIGQGAFGTVYKAELAVCRRII